MRIYGKYTEFFESRFKILRFIKDFQLRLQDYRLLLTVHVFVLFNQLYSNSTNGLHEYINVRN